MMYVIRILAALVVSGAALWYIPLANGDLTVGWLYAILPLFLAVNCIPYLLYSGMKERGADSDLGRLPTAHTPHSLRVCAHGVEMIHILLISLSVTMVYHICHAPMLWQGRAADWWISFAIAAVVNSIVFWNGILCLYLSSVRLGMLWRVAGLLFGWIPGLQLSILRHILLITGDEIAYESERLARRGEAYAPNLCATRYPIVLVHGLLFLDTPHLNYWGRIPDELMANGAKVYLANQQCAASTRDSGKDLARIIRRIVRETGCEKVNIIAHSKGGLDIRAALAFEGIAPYVASVTTIGTPHHGIRLADLLVHAAPSFMLDTFALGYNLANRILGDTDPNFLAAFHDMTEAHCERLNHDTEGDRGHTDGILCRSVSAHTTGARASGFPLNLSYPIACRLDDPETDGLVSEASARWVEDHTTLRAAGRRGISHGDVIDLHRENLPDFDVRDFYINWVADLKSRGL